MLDYDRFAVAARIRGILAGQDAGVIGAAATRLGVSELALRISIDDGDPHPAFEVLRVIVQYYGIDPAWLVTGVYDTQKHRLALEDDASLSRLLLGGRLGAKPSTSSGHTSTAAPDKRPQS